MAASYFTITERYLLATSHGRKSALLAQPLFDGLKLLNKCSNYYISGLLLSIFHYASVYLCALGIIFTLASLIMVNSFGILYTICCMLILHILFIFIGNSFITSKYSWISTQRAIIIGYIIDSIIISYIIIIILLKCNIYMYLYNISLWIIIGSSFRAAFDNIESEGELIAGIFTELLGINSVKFYCFMVC